MSFALLLNLALVVGQAPAAQPSQDQTTPAQPGAIQTAVREEPVVTPGERQICRRQLRIGTLAAYERVCHSASEWQALARGTRASWEQVQGVLGSTHGREGGGGICQPNGVGC